MIDNYHDQWHTHIGHTPFKNITAGFFNKENIQYYNRHKLFIFEKGTLYLPQNKKLCAPLTCYERYYEFSLQNNFTN